MLDLKEAVLRGRSALEAAEKKFDHYDRNAYGNASEINGCLRAQWYARNLKAQPEQDWGFARRGTHAERYLVESLRAANIPLAGVGDEQFSVQDDELMLSCTPDGVLFDTELNEWVVVEFKTIDPRSNLSKLPKPDHVAQVDVGMGLLNRASLIPDGGKVSRGVILYMDASNFNLLYQFEVKHDPRVLTKMSRRAKQMLRARSAEPLDREGLKTNACRYCPFKGPCGVPESPVSSSAAPKVTRANRGSGLHEAVSVYWDAKQDEEDAKSRKDAAKAEIMAEMEKREAKSLPIGEFTASLTSVAGRTTYDTKRAEADGIDLSAYKKVGAPSVRLEVNRNT